MSAVTHSWNKGHSSSTASLISGSEGSEAMAKCSWTKPILWPLCLYRAHCVQVADDHFLAKPTTQTLPIPQKQPQTIPQKRSPRWPLRRNRINTSNQSKTKIPSKMLIPMAVRAKRNQKSTQNLPSKRSPQWPCSLNVKLLGSKNQSY